MTGSSHRKRNGMRRASCAAATALAMALGCPSAFGQTAPPSAATPPSPASPALAPAAPSSPAAPAPNARDAWRARYEDARKLLVEGDYLAARDAFDALARDAALDGDRQLAQEMAHVAGAWAARTTLPPTENGRAPIRTKDEISILYASAFLYGAGTGVWFLLQTQPDSAVTATLPFAAITAAPIVALATIDGAHPLPRGMPHAITAGMYLGLGEGLWLIAYQHAHADRIDVNRERNARWTPETTSTVLWAGATLGAVTAGTLSSGLVTTPGRVSFTASTATWSGVVAGFTAGAILPDSDRRTEQAFAVAGVGYNAGLFGGMLLAGKVSPSVTRVRLVDLSGAAGALALGGIYASLAHRDTDPRIGFGMTALGAAGGLAVGTLLTAGMGREVPGPNGTLQTISWQPTVSPTTGGAVAGVAGFL